MFNALETVANKQITTAQLKEVVGTSNRNIVGGCVGWDQMAILILEYSEATRTFGSHTTAWGAFCEYW